MAKEYVGGLQLVRVVMSDAPGTPSQLWVAAVARDQAVAAVKKEVPAAWTVELSNQPVTKELAARVKLRPGQVSELSSAT